MLTMENTILLSTFLADKKIFHLQFFSNINDVYMCLLQNKDTIDMVSYKKITEIKTVEGQKEYTFNFDYQDKPDIVDQMFFDKDIPLKYNISCYVKDTKITNFTEILLLKVPDFRVVLSFEEPPPSKTEILFYSRCIVFKSEDRDFISKNNIVTEKFKYINDTIEYL